MAGKRVGSGGRKILAQLSSSPRKSVRRVRRVKKPAPGKKPRMSKVLRFGRTSRPDLIVVLLHGLNDSAACCADGVAKPWAAGLPGALVVVPQSPDRSIWSDAGEDPGYDWLRQRGTHDTSNWSANVTELHRVTRARMRHLNSWLDRLLSKYHLDNSQLILAGFSQGSILAALCGAKRQVLGVVACGGITGQPVYSHQAGEYVGGGWMDWEQLLPAGTRSGRCSTRFCAVNGTRDWCVPRRKLEQMLSPFETSWFWDKGAGHDFPDHWYTRALQWMKNLVKGKPGT